jgi:alanine racemase
VNILTSFDEYIDQCRLMDYPVHVKLDTGMHRLGFTESDIDFVSHFFSQNRRLKIKSVFSHLIGSDDIHLDEVTQQQSVLFNQMNTTIGKSIHYPYLKHLANTAAIKRHPLLQYDMVRLGIGLYGVDHNHHLQNVTTLKTTIAQIKKVRKGERVGYGNTGLLDKDADIATVRIGYADGYSRLFSDGVGKMLVNGKMATVVGKVCMDMTMLDITGIKAKEGDEVIVFGEELPVKVISSWSNTISYEILTNVSQRVKRLFYEE